MIYFITIHYVRYNSIHNKLVHTFRLMHIVYIDMFILNRKILS